MSIRTRTIALATAVTGTLPVANGGWGSTDGTFASPTVTLSTSANGNITLTPHGTGVTTTAGRVTITNNTASTSSATGALVLTGGLGITGSIYTNSSAGYFWNSRGGVQATGNGQFLLQNNIGGAATLRTAPFTVATLPAAATVGSGTQAFVSDATTPAYGSAVVGGGAVVVPVHSNGSAWIVG